MKKLLPLLFLFASCGTMRKVVNKEKKIVDSIMTTSRDTVSVSQQTNKTDDVNVKGLDITVTYAPGDLLAGATTGTAVRDTTRWDEYYYKPTSKAPRGTDRVTQIIQDAISHTGNAGRISSISIHVDSLTHASTETSRKDSMAAQAKSAVQVHASDKTSNKTVTRSGLPWWVWAIGMLILLLIVIYRLNKKYGWVKIFP